jgi:hypothetical protein
MRAKLVILQIKPERKLLENEASSLIKKFNFVNSRYLRLYLFGKPSKCRNCY